MTLKKRIFLAGMLLLLPLIGGCLAVTIRDNPYGNVNHNVLRGWIFKNVRVPYTRHSPPPLCTRDIVLPYVSAYYKNDVFSIVEPYTTNLHNTTVTDSQAYGTIFHIEEPFSGYNFYIEFNSNAIGDIAKKHGMSAVYFADIEI
ncbi:MAG: hypothetical protein U9R43_11705, partial [Thermodesulfobacteriota bacterium]|nr:hypothetical protein [Thermodesulfobacteriota bacterium]